MTNQPRDHSFDKLENHSKRPTIICEDRRQITPPNKTNKMTKRHKPSRKRRKDWKWGKDRAEPTRDHNHRTVRVPTVVRVTARR
ncbi:unnamed protein product [Arabis nemorensis]|uniref:Uncharacterized protein n=1 Tax=Arabis nemorensis TaxID=586526 RepID=A0A565BG47_9BRAS|nr:unnamed protein product [Arabis nemorensis]